MPKLIKEEEQSSRAANIFIKSVPLFSIGILGIQSFLIMQKKEFDLKELFFIIENLVIVFCSYIICMKNYNICRTNEPKCTQNMTSSEALFVQHESKFFDEKFEEIISNNPENKNLDNIIEKNVQEYPSKLFCSFCQKVQQYRTRHCSKCQQCVERYDHHCFWIGNCVGQHNHKSFYFFLASQSLFCICVEFWSWFLLCSKNNLIQEEKISQILENCTKVLNYIIYFILFSNTFFILFVVYLFVYHSMLILRNLTTWEHMSRERITYLNYLPKDYNPFYISMWENTKNFFTFVQTDKNINYNEMIPSFSEAEKLKEKSKNESKFCIKMYQCC